MRPFPDLDINQTAVNQARIRLEKLRLGLPGAKEEIDKVWKEHCDGKCASEA